MNATLGWIVYPFLRRIGVDALAAHDSLMWNFFLSFEDSGGVLQDDSHDGQCSGPFVYRVNMTLNS